MYIKEFLYWSIPKRLGMAQYKSRPFY